MAEDGLTCADVGLTSYIDPILIGQGANVKSCELMANAKVKQEITRAYIAKIIFLLLPTSWSLHYATTTVNKDRSDLVKGGIAPRFYSPGGSSNLQFHALDVGSTPEYPIPFYYWYYIWDCGLLDRNDNKTQSTYTSD